MIGLEGGVHVLARNSRREKAEEAHYHYASTHSETCLLIQQTFLIHPIQKKVKVLLSLLKRLYSKEEEKLSVTLKYNQATR